jgi:hypothetical protein
MEKKNKMVRRRKRRRKIGRSSKRQYICYRKEHRIYCSEVFQVVSARPSSKGRLETALNFGSEEGKAVGNGQLDNALQERNSVGPFGLNFEFC